MVAAATACGMVNPAAYVTAWTPSRQPGWSPALVAASIGATISDCLQKIQARSGF